MQTSSRFHSARLEEYSTEVPTDTSSKISSSNQYLVSVSPNQTPNFSQCCSIQQKSDTLRTIPGMSQNTTCCLPTPPSWPFETSKNTTLASWGSTNVSEPSDGERNNNAPDAACSRDAAPNAFHYDNLQPELYSDTVQSLRPPLLQHISTTLSHPDACTAEGVVPELICPNATSEENRKIFAKHSNRCKTAQSTSEPTVAAHRRVFRYPRPAGYAGMGLYAPATLGLQVLETPSPTIPCTREPQRPTKSLLPSTQCFQEFPGTNHFSEPLYAPLSRNMVAKNHNKSDLGHAKEPPPVAGTQNVLRIGCPSCKFDKTKRELHVFWTQNHEPRVQKFSCKKLGKETVFRRAQAFMLHLACLALQCSQCDDTLAPNCFPPFDESTSPGKNRRLNVRPSCSTHRSLAITPTTQSPSSIPDELLYDYDGPYRPTLTYKRLSREWVVEWVAADGTYKAARWSCKKLGKFEAVTRAERFVNLLAAGVAEPQIRRSSKRAAPSFSSRVPSLLTSTSNITSTDNQQEENNKNISENRAVMHDMLLALLMPDASTSAAPGASGSPPVIASLHDNASKHAATFSTPTTAPTTPNTILTAQPSTCATQQVSSPVLRSLSNISTPQTLEAGSCGGYSVNSNINTGEFSAKRKRQFAKLEDVSGLLLPENPVCFSQTETNTDPHYIAGPLPSSEKKAERSYPDWLSSSAPDWTDSSRELPFLESCTSRANKRPFTEQSPT